MSIVRKVLFGLFETVAVVSFCLLLCIGDETEFSAILKLFTIFISSALLAVFTDSPRRLLRYLLPFLICVAAVVHTILRPIVKLFSHCWKMMKKSGSVSQCFIDCQRNYDDWTDEQDEKRYKKTHRTSSTQSHKSKSKVVDFQSHVVNQ